jgi:hypothetical protein
MVSSEIDGGDLADAVIRARVAPSSFAFEESPPLFEHLASTDEMDSSIRTTSSVQRKQKAR